jgi:predicted AAA+ superfamily ATPase
MSTLLRYLRQPILNDLSQKMVFLGGPRQVGKTFFSQSLITNFVDGHPSYFNWDDLEDRQKIKSGIFERDQKLLIFDEIHKFVKWRSLVKGYFDKLKNTHQFLVTGSARLDWRAKTF